MTSLESVICYLGLGSNQNNPQQQLLTAINAIQHWPDTTLTHTSSFYLNPPFGPVKQADFLNAVVCIHTTLTPENILTFAKQQEAAQHRVHTVRWGPRTLDIDVLLYGDCTLNTALLTLPHPGVYERDFVLKPLNEIAPNLILPNGQSVSVCLQGLACSE